MTINFAQILKNFKDEPLKDLDKTDLTLGSACSSALLGNYEDEKNLSGKNKAQRYELAIKIFKSDGEVDLSAEENALLQKLVSKAFGVLVVGQACKMLEGK